MECAIGIFSVRNVVLAKMETVGSRTIRIMDDVSVSEEEVWTKAAHSDKRAAATASKGLKITSALETLGDLSTLGTAVASSE
jgi:hypothetical protein